MQQTPLTPAQYVSLILSSNTIPQDYVRKAVEKDELLNELKKLGISQNLPPSLCPEDFVPASGRGRSASGSGSWRSRSSGSQETLVSGKEDEVDGGSRRETEDKTLVAKESFEEDGKIGEGILEDNHGPGSTQMEVAELEGIEEEEKEEEELKRVKQEMLQKLADERYVEIVLGFVTGGEEILRTHRGN